ncbi:MAG: polyribonucleotide nucleotidyltransferase [Victivallaceae bacterium]
MKATVLSVPVSDSLSIHFETGKIGRQANGAVLVRMGDTVVFSSACYSREMVLDVDFLPLRVDYQEKFSSAGKTLGGFIKREGRPSEKEILGSRLIDRSLRPNMLDGYYQDTQILSYVWSYDGLHLPDPLAICAASAALAISDIPMSKPVAGVRVGLIDGRFVVNPSAEEMTVSRLDLILSGSEDAILMIEGHCDFLSEEELLTAIETGHAVIKKICQAISKWQKEIGKPKNMSVIRVLPQIVLETVKSLSSERIKEVLRIKDRFISMTKLEEIEKDLLKELVSVDNEGDNENPFSVSNIKLAYKKARSKLMRETIKETGLRLDGRGLEDIRHIYIETGLLPRTHGSCLFTRGETQTLAVCTLGGESMGQRFEDLNGEGTHKFYLQYSFPPFSVGEVGRIGAPGRREIGHGKLAQKALQHVLPDFLKFPYAIRLESNITESNGSSSMASVCGGCLALMDAGVPIKEPVSGIAMGLVLDPDSAIILSDISGTEDHLGDMDFKVAGSENGITSFQMDIKVEGITHKIMEQALQQAKRGRLFILEQMNSVLDKPKEVSSYAPRIETMQVKPNKIAVIIGPGGKQIRQIIEETGVQIDINDSGLVSIASTNEESMRKAKTIIEGLIGEPEVGKIYKGKVTSVVNFGAFIEIFPGKEGLCHISELSPKRVENVSDVVREGDVIEVKLLSINEKGQLKLSRKAVLAAQSE